MLQSLIDEYELRSKIITYKKLHKRYLYNRFEKNNYNLLLETLQQLKMEKQDEKFF